MLVPRNEYENMTLTFKVGVATFTLKVDEITEEKIEAFKNHIDLSYYVELGEEEVPEYLFELQDNNEVVQSEETKEPTIQKVITTKKKRKTNKK